MEELTMEDKKSFELEKEELLKEIEQLKEALKNTKAELDEKNKLLTQYDAAYKDQISRCDSLYGIVGSMVDYITTKTIKKN